MKKLHLQLVCLLASFCMCFSAWAERTAPTFPTPVAPESGKTYYLYNVGTGTFFADDTKASSYLAYIGTYGRPIVLTQAESGSWKMQLTDKSKYVYAYNSSSIRLNGSGTSSNSSWSIVETTGGYTWQIAPECSEYYDATKFVGYSSTETQNIVSLNQPTDNIVWQFLPAEATARWTAEHKLYTALEATDSYDSLLEEYETLYANRAAHTLEELTTAAKELNDGVKLSSEVIIPDWNDYPIFFSSSGESNYIGGNSEIFFSIPANGTMSLYATVEVDGDATLVYACLGHSATIYIDGKQVRDINSQQGNKSNIESYFEKLTSGKHQIEWRVRNNSNSSASIKFYHIGVEKTPQISVSLLEPGSLGTEVLYNVDHVKDVRRLKIAGPMNSDDWAKIDMMTSLFELDLSEAEITTIPENQFNRNSKSSSKKFFHKITLPEGLESIGYNAFQSSYIDSINFPNTLKSIGEYAFRDSHLQEALLGDSISSVGTYVFYNCYQLSRATWPKGITSIPQGCFSNCPILSDFTIPYGVTNIGEDAFFSCSQIDADIPSTVTDIDYRAFIYTGTDSITLAEDILLGSKAFAGSNLRYAQFPTSFYSVGNSNEILSNCTELRTLILRSPTVVTGKEKSSFLSGITRDSVTVYVPSFAVNAYKLDEYWYNYKIEGVSTADVKNWTLNTPLVLNARERFEGSPNICINGGGSLKINGEKAQVIDTLNVLINGNSATSSGQIYANCDSVSVTGQNLVRYYTTAKKWFFISLPFNIAVADITNNASAQYAIRYYDGAERAAKGMGASWKNYATTDTITAGTGFILQSSKDATFYFTALNDSAKQYTVNNKEFAKRLEAHVCETPANKGWNLVGNPYLSYYNIHKLNFTAPITTWSVSNKTYTAYSVIDDDLALKPGQAFFVQCPDEVESISFPLNGRQLTSEILDQNATQAHKDKVSTRQLIDLRITQGDYTDRARVVLNEDASLGYEYACDASKFMSEDNEVPQLYSLDANNTRYAINERPETDGTVRLGFHTARGGVFTLSLGRCDAQDVFLTDHATGTITDLKSSDYHFTAEAGTDNSRFTLNIRAKQPTDIDIVEDNSVVSITENGIVLNQTAEIYATDGRIVTKTSVVGEAITLPVGTYLVKVGEKVQKVSITR